MEKIKISIIGATGYTGMELIRYLLHHKRVKIERLFSQSFAGKKISEIYPFLSTDLLLEEFEEKKISSSEFVFSCLPHGFSMSTVGNLVDKGLKVIDLSADFRLPFSLYEKWYRTPHLRKDLLPKAVYGLCEIFREKIKKAELVANPGCYSTSVILPLAPLVKENLIGEKIVVDSKSGVTGAGRKPSLFTHFPEVNENLSLYRVGEHRHLPEMEHILKEFSGKKVDIFFVPHLVPLNRGILSTLYVKMEEKTSEKEAYLVLKEFYHNSPFVKVLSPPQVPRLRDVLYTNFCLIGLKKIKDTLILVSVIDNLGKGASGQAIQNMNLMLGFPEEMGFLL